MKVKVSTPTDLQLASGRRFTLKRPGEVDLTELGYDRKEQQELASKHWIDPLEDDDAGVTDAAVTLAASEGIDLAELTGTGSAGRIVLDDVRAAISERAEKKAAAEADEAAGGDDEEEDDDAGD